jgi:hypothetical protein
VQQLVGHGHGECLIQRQVAAEHAVPVEPEDEVDGNVEIGSWIDLPPFGGSLEDAAEPAGGA